MTMNEPEPIEERQNGTVLPKLLLADDSTTIRRVVELTFADEGIMVTAVADAASAMQKFVEIQPDIVMVDVGLPGTSGYQICEMIKQDEATAHIPVLLLVGSFEPFDHDEAERVSADGFLMKPFKSIRELITRVKELLEPQVSENEAEDEMQSETVEDINFRPLSQNVVQMPGIPETMDIENLYQRSFSNIEDTGEFETVDILGDSAMDDELIDASYHRDSGFRTSRTAEDQAEPDIRTKGFDWSPASRLEPETPAHTGVGGSVETHQPAGVVQEYNAAQEQSGEVAKTATEPSKEFIALVADRVVELLSERAIRDVAKEVVPRIAEKLIREALAEEKKT